MSLTFIYPALGGVFGFSWALGDEELMPVLVEQVNVVEGNDLPLAWQSIDTLGRLKNLSSLRPEERRRLIEIDEKEMLVGHLAEVAQLRVYPFRLEIIEDKVGSAVMLDTAGEELTVFRRMTDMLEARVIKHPEDVRARSILNWYEYWIEPQAQALNQGEWLVFFSPPDRSSDFENKYGFAYLYQRDGRGINAYSVRLDWKDDIKFGAYDLGYFDSEYGRPQEVLLALGGEVAEIVSDFGRQMDLYQQIRAWVETNAEVKLYFTALINQNRAMMDRLIEVFRVQTLSRYQPEIWRQVQMTVELYGHAWINIGCGLMSFGGAGPVDSILMGLGGDSGYHGEWHKGNCRTCGATQVEVGDCDVCRNCQWEFDVGIRT